MHSKLRLFFILIGLSSCVFSQNRVFLVTDYLNQVKLYNTGIRSSQHSQTSSQLRLKEAHFSTTPVAFSSIKILSDKKETLQSFFMGEDSFFANTSFGISTTTDFGLKAKLYYAVDYTHLQNTGSVPVTSYFDTSPVLEISQSLLRNWGGEETKAEQSILETQIHAQFHIDAFAIKKQLSEAEGKYWDLVLAIEKVKVQQEALERAVKIKDWSTQRQTLHLADASEGLQSNANFTLRRLEFQSSVDDYKASVRAFNKARGLRSDHLDETLDTLNETNVDHISYPKKPEKREDLVALEYALKMSESNAVLNKEKLKGSLEIFGSLSLNHKGTDLSQAPAYAASFDHRSIGFGIQYTMLLDSDGLRDAQKGVEEKYLSESLRYQNTLFEQEQEWVDLIQKLEAAEKQLEISTAIESAQKEKWLYEQDRHRKGRSTLYQVLLFEQDYIVSQFTKIKIKADILNMVAKLNLYGTYKGESNQ